MAIQLNRTTEIEPDVSVLNFRGTPVSATKRELSPESLWDYYRKFHEFSASDSVVTDLTKSIAKCADD